MAMKPPGFFCGNDRRLAVFQAAQGRVCFGQFAGHANGRDRVYGYGSGIDGSKLSWDFECVPAFLRLLCEPYEWEWTRPWKQRGRPRSTRPPILPEYRQVQLDLG